MKTTKMLALSVAAAALLLPAAPARADGGTAGNDLQIAQTLGDRELTVVLRRVTAIPGPLHVDVLTHVDPAGPGAGRLRLALTPTGAASDVATGARTGITGPVATLTLGGRPGTYSTELGITRAGPWELLIDDGTHRARIPFDVPRMATSPAEWTVYAGFIAAGALLLVTVLVAVRARRGGWAFVPATGLVAACSAAVTAAVLSVSTPQPPGQGSDLDPSVDGADAPYSQLRPESADLSRPPVQLALTNPPTATGTPADMWISLTDVATGLPVDDVVPHGAALMHLLVVGPGGRLWHLHPVWTRGGTYEVRFTAPEAGHYALSVELARRGGGLQLLRSPRGFDVTGRPSGGAEPAEGVGGALDVPEKIVPGTSTPITLRVGDDAALQPWLGMVGHLIVVGPLAAGGRDTGAATQNAEVWAHSHSMGSLAHDESAMSGLMPRGGDSPADESVAAYGPDVSFVYSFPAPGTYRIWIQVLKDHKIMTFPYDLSVPGAAR